jgi:hypothetical protein
MILLYIILFTLSVLLIFLIYKLFKNVSPGSNETYNKTPKIFLDGLSREYTPHIIKYILNSIPDHEIVDDKKNSDIYVYHINNNDYTKDKINIVISGEPDDINDNIDLYIGPVIKDNTKLKSIYYPQMYSSLIEHKKSVNKDDYKTPNKNKFCAYMYRQRHDHRIKYFNLLSKYKRVDALGDCCKNTDIPSTRHISNENETYNDIAVDLYKNYKFVLAIENTDKNGYFTEKLNNPLIANTIPLYWGNKKVFDYINKKRVIYIPDYTDDELIEIIKRIDNDDNEYNKIINEKWYVNEEKTPEQIEKQLQKSIKENIDTLLNKKYVSANCMGGLGNQLFSIYTAISYGIDNDKIPIFEYRNNNRNRNTYWKTLFKNLKTYTDNKIEWTNIYDNDIGTYYNSNNLQDKNVLFYGYFQSYNNFIKNLDNINNLIGIQDFQNKVKDKYKKLFNNSKTLGVHFRLGDYKNINDNVLPDSYYISALQKIDLNDKNILIFCEKEDYNTIENRLQNILNNKSFHIVKEAENEIDELLLLSLCDYIITANSTFSFWAGVFSNHKNVYLPIFKWLKNTKDRFVLPGWTLIE